MSSSSFSGQTNRIGSWTLKRLEVDLSHWNAIAMEFDWMKRLETSTVSMNRNAIYGNRLGLQFAQQLLVQHQPPLTHMWDPHRMQCSIAKSSQKPKFSLNKNFQNYSTANRMGPKSWYPIRNRSRWMQRCRTQVSGGRMPVPMWTIAKIKFSTNLFNFDSQIHRRIIALQRQLCR